MDDVLRQTQVEAGLDLVSVASLEDRTNHSERALLASILQLWIVQAAQRLSQWDQLIVVGCSLVHRNQEAV